jgi:hypothetical protein
MTLKRESIRPIVFWIATGILILQTAVAAYLNLTHHPFVAETIKYLGYPTYLLTILGTWRVLCVIALIVPGFSRIKEWAYAGLFFDLTGAVASHVAMGDGFDTLAFPLVLIILTCTSWAFRPAGR